MSSKGASTFYDESPFRTSKPVFVPDAKKHDILDRDRGRAHNYLPMKFSDVVKLPPRKPSGSIRMSVENGKVKDGSNSSKFNLFPTLPTRKRSNLRKTDLNKDYSLFSQSLDEFDKETSLQQGFAEEEDEHKSFEEIINNLHTCISINIVQDSALVSELSDSIPSQKLEEKGNHSVSIDSVLKLKIDKTAENIKKILMEDTNLSKGSSNEDETSSFELNENDESSKTIEPLATACDDEVDKSFKLESGLTQLVSGFVSDSSFKLNEKDKLSCDDEVDNSTETACDTDDEVSQHQDFNFGHAGEQSEVGGL
ncbi:hypothetical protein GOBAR_DD05900 [Gossypium barbadense]|nr:hypothetical protein GOBAR_DD05900 [Gossypium barbadense]